MARVNKAMKQPLDETLSQLSPLVIIENEQARCQYDASCKKPPLKEGAFCETHESFPSKMQLSGSEPPYTPSLWNSDPNVQMVHNCFAYALNILSSFLAEKCKNTKICDTHQPGEQAKWPPMKEKTCPNLIARILGDSTYIPIDYEGKCPAGTSMVAFIIDTKRDYHVLRLDDTGKFSHKGGQGPATDKDALGHSIADVRLANFNYSDKPDKLNYTHFCGYFCISRSVVHAAVPKGGRRMQKSRRRQQKKNRTRLRRQRNGK